MPGYRTPLAATALTVAATFSPANLAAPGAEFSTTREGIVGTRGDRDARVRAPARVA